MNEDAEHVPATVVEISGSAAAPERVVLVLANDDGEVGRTGVSGPGGVARVAVGEPGRRSSVWRVWANTRKDDVYVAAREAATHQKFSLHESGDWRYQWTSGERAVAYTGQSRRTIDRWSRPSEHTGGWTHALSIWVPHGALSSIPSDRAPRRGGIDFVPEPAVGEAIGIHVVIAKTDQGFVPTKGTVPITGFSLPGGEVVIVLAGKRRMTERDVDWLRSNHRQARQSVPSDLLLGEGTRMALFGQTDGEVRWVWDLAADKEP